ncbi:MAG: polysaccharide biosynthesis protein [Bacteroidales bacterium]|nr:polysaccharide biosynthesis protein [Bacteroidales bacterium]
MYAPRWVVLAIDMVISAFALCASYALRFNFEIPVIFAERLTYTFIIVLSLRLISFLIAKTYQGIVRYTSTNDALRICVTVLSGSCVAFLVSAMLFAWQIAQYRIPFSILVLDCIFTMAIMTISRFVVKAIYLENRHNDPAIKNVVIYGADANALTTKRTVDRDAGNYRVIALIDDDNKLAGKVIDGIKIYSPADMEEVFDSCNVKYMIIAHKFRSKANKQKLIDFCLEKNVKVMSTPTVSTWINGELSFRQIRKIRIEDLLERDPIQLDEGRIREDIANKVVMVTGAAGSIGSEIVRQLTKFNPKEVVIVDRAESPLYDLELELREKLKFYDFEIVIGSITDQVRLTQTFDAFHPNIIYHAAAYKHVPMMENNPSQAIANNVRGTKYLADMSLKYGVGKFVMVSTDKAVNPTNVMGCSKRICEIYTQSLNGRGITKFVTTRFGNVLGSNGSVIPRFKDQIEKGGPVTVTHPEITRFFMTIPEACQLVLQAGTLGNGGEIFIFDMGKSVKIIDLAKNMIKLYGLQLGKDISIKFTGLRPGEKLYEEVLNDKEKTLPTTHSQIMVAKVRQYDFAKVSVQIDELISLVDTMDNMKIVAMMKKIVPEFKSENSIYAALDNASNIEDNVAEIVAESRHDFQKPSTTQKSNSAYSISKKFALMR